MLSGAALGATMAAEVIVGTIAAAVAVVAVITATALAARRWQRSAAVPRPDELPAEVARPAQLLLVVVVVAAVVPSLLLGGSTDRLLAPGAPGAAAALAVGGPIADRRLRRAAQRRLQARPGRR